MPAKPGSRRRSYADEPYEGASQHKPVDPHSQWQILVETQRAKKDLSLRKLGTLAQIPPGNLFNWLRSKRGGPLRVNYTTTVNERLARALGLKPDVLAAAYNNSAFKPLDPAKPDPAPRAPALQETSTAFKVESLKGFLAVIRASGIRTFTLEQLEQFAAPFLPRTEPVKPLDSPE